MLERKLARIEKQLKTALGPKWLQERGRSSRFERRTARVLTTPKFVTSLLHSLGTRRVESIADLQRDFNADHGTTVYYKPYYERLDTAGFVELMRSTFESLMTHLYMEALKPLKDSVLGEFEDIIVHDGCSFALHNDLVHAFKGRFTKVSPAAVELHATMSLRNDNLTAVTITADAECERHHVPEPKELRGKLFLADRGYDTVSYMGEIDSAGGHFCVRVRSSLDPIVVKIHRGDDRYRTLEGRRLSAVLKRLPKGKVHDIDIAWFDRKDKVKQAFRLLTKYSPTEGAWTRVMTNLPRERFEANKVMSAYRLRWQVELYFKELKSYANLHAFSTRKAYIAEGLIWASLCVAFLKRYFAHSCQQACASNAISTRRVAMCSHTFLGSFFRCVCNGMRNLRTTLLEVFEFLEFNARRSNPQRERKSGRLALGFTPSGASA